MDKTDNIMVDKPLDWPQNQREFKLENILNAINEFQAKPDYINKEVLLTLITEIDPNQHDDFGVVRVTDYETALINQLYTYAVFMHLDGLKLFLYKEITETTRYFNMLSKSPEKFRNINDIENYNWLILPLRLYYNVFKNFNYFKKHSFCEEILDILNIYESFEKQEKISLEDIEYAFTNLMFDLSNASGINTIPFIEFDRNELLKLFYKEFEIIKKVKKDPLKSPLKGVLKMTISNWILRSRNNYQHSSIFKCLDDEASNNSVDNHEIWMQSIDYLNDKREGKTIKELFANKRWIDYDWAKKIKLCNPYTFYVTSFSKTNPTYSLKNKYGKNVYGYRSDKIASIVAPLINNNGFTQFGQTISYDIVYNREIAKDELNFLFKIIDGLFQSDIQKIKFANEIISYWFLSFKDKKWQAENERRYQIFYYDSYPYIELSKDKRFLKIKSSIFLFPDNISNDNNQFDIIKANIFQRYYATATKEFVQCNQCLNINFEIFGCREPYKCPICGSLNCIKVNPNELRKKHPEKDAL